MNFKKRVNKIKNRCPFRGRKFLVSVVEKMFDFYCKKTPARSSRGFLAYVEQ